jgi:hypothetical protein
LRQPGEPGDRRPPRGTCLPIFALTLLTTVQGRAVPAIGVARTRPAMVAASPAIKNHGRAVLTRSVRHVTLRPPSTPVERIDVGDVERGGSRLSMPMRQIPPAAPRQRAARRGGRCRLLPRGTHAGPQDRPPPGRLSRRDLGAWDGGRLKQLAQARWAMAIPARITTVARASGGVTASPITVTAATRATSGWANCTEPMRAVPPRASAQYQAT